MNKTIIIFCLVSQAFSLFPADQLIFTETGPADRLDEEELFYRSQIRQKARAIQFERCFEDEGQLQEFKSKLERTIKNFKAFKTDKATGQYLFCVKNKGRLVALVVVTLFPGDDEKSAKRGALEVVPFYTGSHAVQYASARSEGLVVREDDEEEQVVIKKVVPAPPSHTKIVQVQPVRRASTSSDGSSNGARHKNSSSGESS